MKFTKHFSFNSNFLQPTHLVRTRVLKPHQSKLLHHLLKYQVISTSTIHNNFTSLTTRFTHGSEKILPLSRSGIFSALLHQDSSKHKGLSLLWFQHILTGNSNFLILICHTISCHLVLALKRSMSSFSTLKTSA